MLRNLLLAGVFTLACSVTPAPIGRLATPAAPSASAYINSFQVPLPLPRFQGDGMAAPVSFLGQAGIDRLCGGKDQVVACAVIGGGWMALPNPCQARFRGEAYAAVACHELGHIHGWGHER